MVKKKEKKKKGVTDIVRRKLKLEGQFGKSLEISKSKLCGNDFMRCAPCTDSLNTYFSYSIAASSTNLKSSSKPCPVRADTPQLRKSL